jgi:hypothetical protein
MACHDTNNATPRQAWMYHPAFLDHPTLNPVAPYRTRPKEASNADPAYDVFLSRAGHNRMRRDTSDKPGRSRGGGAQEGRRLVFSVRVAGRRAPDFRPLPLRTSGDKARLCQHRGLHLISRRRHGCALAERVTGRSGLRSTSSRKPALCPGTQRDSQAGGGGVPRDQCGPASAHLWGSGVRRGRHPGAGPALEPPRVALGGQSERAVRRVQSGGLVPWRTAGQTKAPGIAPGRLVPYRCGDLYSSSSATPAATSGWATGSSTRGGGAS